MVGTANDENAVERVGSKRSIAFSRPSDATWTRSSSGSLLLRIAACELSREGQEPLHQRLVRRVIPVPLVAREQPSFFCPIALGGAHAVRLVSATGESPSAGVVDASCHIDLAWTDHPATYRSDAVMTRYR